MRLLERLRAAFAAFKNGQVHVRVVPRDEARDKYRQYMIEREQAKEQAIGALEPQSRFVAIKMISSREMPWQPDVDILVEGLRQLETAEQRYDAMQALAVAVPDLVLNRTFKALCADMASFMAARVGNPAE